MQRIPAYVKVGVVLFVVAGVAGLAMRLRGSTSDAGPVTSSSSFRSAYLTNGVASCISAARTTLSGQGVAVTDDKITSYCACTINKVNDSFTDQEIAAADQASINQTAMPPALSAKLIASANVCAVHLH